MKEFKDISKETTLSLLSVEDKIELLKELIDEIPTFVIASYSNEEFISSEDIGWDEENEQLNIYTNL